MPIYIQIDGIKGDVSAEGWERPIESGAAGGVWKTTNFLTSGPAGPTYSKAGVGALRSMDGGSTWQASSPVARPKIKVFMCPSDTSIVQISRISLTPGGGGVEGHEVAANVKLSQLIKTARGAPGGKLYVATDAGVYSSINNQGRLLVGVDNGVWRSGAANKQNSSNNLKQIGLAVHNSTSVEIIVTDAGGRVLSSHRLSNVSVSMSGGTFTLTFNGQTTGG